MAQRFELDRPFINVQSALQPGYKIDNIFKKIDKRADTRRQLLTNYGKGANA